MYRLNPLLRNVLITADEVVFHAPTKQTIDVRLIEQSIIIAEERFIRPLLGYGFYTALCNSKNLLITGANKAAQEILINDSLTEGSPAVVLAEGMLVNSYKYLTLHNQALWTEQLWKLIAECVMLVATPEGFIQFGSVGAHHNQSAAGPMSGEGVVTPDLRSMKWMMDKKMMDRISPLLESLHNWFCYWRKEDRTRYSLYTAACECDHDGTAFKRKTDIVTGVYDDDITDNYCCE